MKLMWTSVFIFTFFKFVRLELSPDFANCRKDFFYQETAPILPELKSTTQICQKLGNKSYFATEYDTEKRIPLYSAYTLSFEKCGKRENDWFFEAKLADIDDPNMIEMDYENHNYSRTSIYGSRQAVEEDFKQTDYDKGHLNPQMFHCESSDSRKATNTMTNIAPQYFLFNQNIWNMFETDLYNISKVYCSFEGARRFYITGVKPSFSDYISDGRVNVPTHYWTAVCCDSSGVKGANRSAGWSMAFKGENVKNSTIYIYTIQNFFPTDFYKLFADYTDENGNTVSNCLFNPTKADTITDEIATRTDIHYVKVKTSVNNSNETNDSFDGPKNRNEL
ncbi:endonuclease domain-containing 1 protein-like isoform X2 [Mytilus californianus]|nr:endonuclease domain-containing 1 protein-like isoform X2 [Mytilus californianus]